MVETRSGALYTGITTDVERRFRQHCGGIKAGGARFFGGDPAQAVVYCEPSENRSLASKREYHIKK